MASVARSYCHHVSVDLANAVLQLIEIFAMFANANPVLQLIEIFAMFTSGNLVLQLIEIFAMFANANLVLELIETFALFANALIAFISSSRSLAGQLADAAGLDCPSAVHPSICTASAGGLASVSWSASVTG